jgi:hypothetical protein
MTNATRKFLSPMVTTDEFLRFWAKAIASLQIHPDDAEALKSNRHALTLDTLVGPFMGPVRTAPVVLLTLNPGFSGVEQGEAKMQAVRELMGPKSRWRCPVTYVCDQSRGTRMDGAPPSAIRPALQDRLSERCLRQPHSLSL